MTTARPPGDKNHLERLLTKWADGEPAVTTGHLRRVVGIVVIARMLGGLPDGDGKPRVAFKGGGALEMRFGLRSRSTKDLDAAFRGDLDEAFVLIAGAVDAGWNGFTGRATEPERIENAKVKPRPIRFDIKVAYKGKSFITIPFEISAAEAQSMRDPELVRVAINLDAVQLGGPDEFAFLPLPYQIAQKLHACTEHPTDEHPNDRVRDLPDLMLIEELGVTDGDLSAVRAACVEIFEGRKMHEWPPVLTIHPGWDSLWDNLTQKEDLGRTLEEAVAAVAAFIARIDAVVC